MCDWKILVNLRSGTGDECCATCESFELHGAGDVGLCFSPDVGVERPPLVREHQRCDFYSYRWADTRGLLGAIFSSAKGAK